MVDVDDILRTAIKKDASDVHLISGIRPMLRIARHLTPYEGGDALTPEDMADIYDYFIRGNIDKDAVFTETKNWIHHLILVEYVLGLIFLYLEMFQYLH